MMDQTMTLGRLIGWPRKAGNSGIAHVIYKNQNDIRTIAHQ
jgi:hypothetical protein